MRKAVFKYILLLLPFTAFGRQYTVQQIKHVSDSVLHSMVNETVFSHCLYDTGTYYSYQNGKETEWAMQAGNTIDNPDLLDIFVRYQVAYHDTLCADLDSIKGVVSLIFNNHLELTNKPDVSFIPAFAMQNEKCPFISQKRATEIAVADINDRLKEDTTHIKVLHHAKISHDNAQLEWRVYFSIDAHMPLTATIGKNVVGDYSIMGVVVDPVTGVVKDHFFYGWR